MIVNVLRPVLSGTTVLVTAQRRADELSGALQRRGAEVTTASALGVESHLDEAGLLAATRELVADPPDVLVVTTGIGFRGWLDTAEASGLGHDLVEALAQTRIVARGPKARGALQAAGLVPDWVAESETSAEIVQLLLTEGVDGLHVAHGATDQAGRLHREVHAQLLDLEQHLAPDHQLGPAVGDIVQRREVLVDPDRIV